MEEIKIVFNHLKFRKLLEDTFGPKSLRNIAENIPVSRTTLYGWISGKNRNGPTGKSWDKIIPLLKKRNITIKPKDFYENEKNETGINKDYITHLSEYESSYTKKKAEEYYKLFDKYLDMLNNQKNCLQKKDEQIELLTKETFDLKMEIQSLKKILRTNGIRYEESDEK